MENLVAKMKAAAAKAETDVLVAISVVFAATTDANEITMLEFVEAELESRLSEAEFVAHMATVEAVMDAHAA